MTTGRGFLIGVVLLALVGCAEPVTSYRLVPEGCVYDVEALERYFRHGGIDVQLLAIDGLRRSIAIHPPDAIVKLSSTAMSREELARQGIPHFDDCGLPASMSSEFAGRGRISELVKEARALAPSDRIYGRVAGEHIVLYFERPDFLRGERGEEGR